MTTGEKIEQLRKERGWTVNEVAFALNFDRHTISRWEAGSTRPSNNALKEIAKLFSVPVDTLQDDHFQKKDGSAEAVKIAKEIIKNESVKNDEISKMKAEIESMKSLLKEAEDQRDKWKEVAQILKDAARETKKKIDSLEQEILFLREDKEELHKRLDQAKDDVANPEIEDLKREIEKYKDILLKMAFEKFGA